VYPSIKASPQLPRCNGNRVDNLRFADDIDIIEQSNEKLQDTVDKLHTESA